MPAAELAEWAAFEALYGPILVHERIDAAAALIAAVLANVNRGRGKRPLSPADFMPRYRSETHQAQPLEVQIARVEKLFKGKTRPRKRRREPS